MTIDQGLAFGIILVTMMLFVWGRPRYDIVACLSLMVILVAVPMLLLVWPVR